MKQNIVITMAGRGSRFYDAGYTVPKYEIPAHGKTLFEWSMRSLARFVGRDSRLIFVCLAGNHSGDFVRAQCRDLGLEDVHILELAEVTDGQATSAFLSRDLWLDDAALTIYNIDTYVHPRALSPAAIPAGSDGWVPCFPGAGDHWSFVRLDDRGWAVEVAEKRRISPHASVGLYWFARAGDFADAYSVFFSDPANLVKGERYVAPLYQHLLQAGRKISIADLPVADVHVLGTPAELETFIAKKEDELA